jgi:hypothetical protein
MPTGLKRVLAYVAIFAIALQALLTGFAVPDLAKASFDPATIICHSDGSGTGQQVPQPATADGCCAHCILSGASAMASAPEAPAIVAMPPVDGESLRPPATAAAPLAAHSSNHFARGPPQSV